MLSDLIKERKSVREYLSKDIPDDVLKTILQAGYLAPSWMNSQPWKFILVKNQQTKDLLSKLALNQPHVKNANAVIVCVADIDGWSREEFSKVLKSGGMSDVAIDKILKISTLYPALLGKETAKLRAVEQMTYAVSYMMLQAEELGVSSCIIGAISNALTNDDNETSKKAHEVLNLSDNQIIATMITLGYAKENIPANKIRKDFDEVVYFESVK